METATDSVGNSSASARQFARRLLTIGENRVELLMVEVQEERQLLLHAIVLALGVAAFGLLSGIALTAAVVVFFWAYSPAGVLLTLTVLYAATTGLFYQRFTLLQRDWKTLPATLDQLGKDRACLETLLE